MRNTVAQELRRLAGSSTENPWLTRKRHRALKRKWNALPWNARAKQMEAIQRRLRA